MEATFLERPPLEQAPCKVSASEAMALRNLAAQEARELSRCEAVIERGLKTFVEVGRALLEIRQRNLYSSQYPGFREYCIARWGFTDSRARQLISAAKVAEEVQTVTRVTVPSEKIARELNRLPQDQQAGCWQDIVMDAGDAENVTAATVKKTVDLWIADNEPYRPGAEDEDELKPAGPKPVLRWDCVAMLLGETYWTSLASLENTFAGGIPPEDATRRWLRQPKTKRDRSLDLAGRIREGTRLLLLDAIAVMDRAGKIRQRGEGFDAEYQFINPNLPVAAYADTEHAQSDDPDVAVDDHADGQPALDQATAILDARDPGQVQYDVEAVAAMMRRIGFCVALVKEAQDATHSGDIGRSLVQVTLNQLRDQLEQLGCDLYKSPRDEERDGGDD